MLIFSKKCQKFENWISFNSFYIFFFLLDFLIAFLNRNNPADKTWDSLDNKTIKNIRSEGSKPWQKKCMRNFSIHIQSTLLRGRSKKTDEGGRRLEADNSRGSAVEEKIMQLQHCIHLFFPIINDCHFVLVSKFHTCSSEGEIRRLRTRLRRTKTVPWAIIVWVYICVCVFYWANISIGKKSPSSFYL